MKMARRWVLIVLVLVVAMSHVWGDAAEGEAETEAEVVAGLRGAVPLRRASAATRSVKRSKDPTTQYVVLNNLDSSQSCLRRDRRGRCIRNRTLALCYSVGRCFLKRLRCPRSCPRRTTSPIGKGCFIDCHPSKCEASCRARKADCNGFGALCYDPRFVGGDGVMFYFHGNANENFCLLSDSDLHVNAHFIGTRSPGRKRDFTWVDALGIMFANHHLSIEAKKLGAWDAKVDRLSLSYDGNDIQISIGESSTWQSPSGDVQIERTDRVNSVNIIVEDLMEVDVSIVPITEEDNKIHNYQLNLNEDCFAHLDIQFKFMNLSSVVDGVLGQTYRPDFKNPVKVGVPMPIMGGEDKFFATSLFKDDCKASKFKTTRGTMEQQQLGEKMFQCSSTKMERGGVLCKR